MFGKSEDPKISFIIPVFNEAFNIPNVLRDVHGVIEKHPQWEAEVIVVEDGSLDDTRQVIMKELGKYPQIQLVLHETNQGYAKSLKDGIAKAKASHLMYVGADEEFDCSEIPNFVEPLISGEADVVLGVRWQRNAYQLFRFFLSVIYIFLLNYLFKLRVNDYNWSQAWSRELVNRINPRSNSLFILPEVIIKAFEYNYRVKEVPSNHVGRRHGKSSVNLKIMAHALLDALRFWRRQGRTRAHKSKTISVSSPS